MTKNERQWYQQSAKETFNTLDTSRKGLKSDEVKTRLDKYGYNELEYKKPSVIMRFLRQFHNPLVYILITAASITGFLTYRGEDMLADTIVIMGVVLVGGGRRKKNIPGVNQLSRSVVE